MAIDKDDFAFFGSVLLNRGKFTGQGTSIYLSYNICDKDGLNTVNSHFILPTKLPGWYTMLVS